MKVALRGGGSCAQNGIYRPFSHRDTPQLPWCAPNAAIFTLKGRKTKTRKVPRVLHVAVKETQ